MLGRADGAGRIGGLIAGVAGGAGRRAAGPAPMPPRWVMGIAFGAYADEARLAQIAATWRDLKLPVDAIWGDGGVFSDRSVNDFTTKWRQGTLDRLHDQHFVLGRWTMQ